jgi:hypothetical protein
VKLAAEFQTALVLMKDFLIKSIKGGPVTLIDPNPALGG